MCVFRASGVNSALWALSHPMLWAAWGTLCWAGRDGQQPEHGVPEPSSGPCHQAHKGKHLLGCPGLPCALVFMPVTAGRPC